MQTWCILMASAMKHLWIVQQDGAASLSCMLKCAFAFRNTSICWFKLNWSAFHLYASLSILACSSSTRSLNEPQSNDILSLSNPQSGGFLLHFKAPLLEDIRFWTLDF